MDSLLMLRQEGSKCPAAGKQDDADGRADASHTASKVQDLTDGLLCAIFECGGLRGPENLRVLEAVCRHWSVVVASCMDQNVILRRLKSGRAQERMDTRFFRWSTGRRVLSLMIDGLSLEPLAFGLSCLTACRHLQRLEVACSREPDWASLPALPQLTGVIFSQQFSKSMACADVSAWRCAGADCLTTLRSLESLVLCPVRSKHYSVWPWLSLLTSLTSLGTGVVQAVGEESPVAVNTKLVTLYLYGTEVEYTAYTDICLPPQVTHLELLDGFGVHEQVLYRAQGLLGLVVQNVSILRDATPDWGDEQPPLTAEEKLTSIQRVEVVSRNDFGVAAVCLSLPLVKVLHVRFNLQVSVSSGVLHQSDAQAILLNSFTQSQLLETLIFEGLQAQMPGIELFLSRWLHLAHLGHALTVFLAARIHVVNQGTGKLVYQVVRQPPDDLVQA